MEPGKIIAENMSALRRERGMSLGDLSRACGISQRSSGAVYAPAGAGGAGACRRPPGGCGRAAGRDDYRIRCYFPRTAERNFEFFYAELEEEAAHATVGHSRRSQEYVYVLRGALAVRAGGGEWELREGDALRLAESSVPHEYVNRDSGRTEFIVVNYYPY